MSDSGLIGEGQMITYALDEIVQTFKELYLLVNKVEHYVPDKGSMQRSSNVYWMRLQQHGRIQEGWDLTGQEDGVLELSISGNLGEPSNTFRKLRIDDLRDERSYRAAIRADAVRLIGDMEAKGLRKAAIYGSFCQTYPGAFGPGVGQTPVWDMLANAESRMFDTEMYTDAGVCSFLNATTYVAGGKSLVEGTANFTNAIPDKAYRDGKIQNQIAGIDEVYRHNKLIVLPAAAGACTVVGDVSLLPEANTGILPNGTKDNVDNRFGEITVNTATGVAVGDKFYFTDVFAISLGEKLLLDYEQTFTVAAINGVVLTISPRPMAYDDTEFDTNELAREYTNINTQIKDTNTLNFMNVNARKTNVVMTKDSMVIASQPIPFAHELFKDLNSHAFTVGPISGMVGYQSSLGKLEGSIRMAIWYDWQIKKPMEVGVVLDNQ